MIITFMMVGLLLSGGLAWYMETKRGGRAKLIALLTTIIFGISFIVYVMTSSADYSNLVVLTDVSWISLFNIRYIIALDNLSNMLLLLTFILSFNNS
mgnify:FL=1